MSTECHETATPLRIPAEYSRAYVPVSEIWHLDGEGHVHSKPRTLWNLSHLNGQTLRALSAEFYFRTFSYLDPNKTRDASGKQGLVFIDDPSSLISSPKPWPRTKLSIHHLLGMLHGQGKRHPPHQRHFRPLFRDLAALGVQGVWGGQGGRQPCLSSMEKNELPKLQTLTPKP